LLRLSRLVRLLKSMPDLLTLVNGIRAAMRAVCSSLVLIIGINYIFAIVLNMFLKDIQDVEEVQNRFGTLGNCMWILMLDGTLMDSTGSTLAALKDLEEHNYNWTVGWSMILVFALYVLLTSITVMNMLIGVLCEVVSEVKKHDEEKVAIEFMKLHLRGMLEQIDLDGNGQISKAEISALVNIPSAVKVLEELEVVPSHLLDLTERLFEDDAANGRVQEVTREELMEIILKIRGFREVSMQDMVEVHCDLRTMVLRVEENMNKRFETMLQKLS